jgi:dual specificity MAP kinase phosphatase
MKFINWLILKWYAILDYLSRLILGHSIVKYIRITPDIFLGGSFNKNFIKKLKKSGVTAVVNMRTSQPVSGIKTLHLPTKDKTAPSEKDLEKGVSFIKKQIEKDSKVYIHCRAGRGRGPTMAIAYLISTGYKLEEAVNLIKQVRRFIKPTRSQIESLKKFEKKYR